MIRTAGSDDIEIIRTIAKNTWPVTFRDILSDKQIEYMLEMMYSHDSLIEQMSKKNHVYLLSYENIKEGEVFRPVYTGYLSYELNYSNRDKTKIHKIYILPQFQGYGYGRALIEEVRIRAISNSNYTVTLNVNRNNRAVEFYKTLGFVITAEEDIDIGNGFLMEDYKMEMIIE